MIIRLAKVLCTRVLLNISAKKMPWVVGLRIGLRYRRIQFAGSNDINKQFGFQLSTPG